MTVIRIEYGWNGGSKFLTDNQNAEFRKLLAQLRKLGFKSERYLWTTEYMIEESELGFNNSVRVIHIYDEMLKLMRVAEDEYQRRVKNHGMAHIVNVYGDVFISRVKLTGIQTDVQVYLSSYIKR